MYKQAIVNNLIKLAGIIDGARDLSTGTVNAIVIPTGNKSESLLETIGYNVGELFGKPKGDTEELGPYKDVVKHIKDTEIAEAYLREAAALRRKTRILKRKRKEEEGLRSSIARSRFF